MKHFHFLFVLLAACAGPHVNLSPQYVPDAHRSVGNSREKAQPALQPPSAKQPAWYLPSRYKSKAWMTLWNNLELSSVGEEQAILLTSLGYVALDRATGFIGQLKGALASDQLRLGDADRVFVLNANGQLTRFSSVRPLLSSDHSGGSVVGVWSNWRGFDAAPGCLAVATDDAVRISSDRGQSFRISHPEPGRIINNVWCRPDGLVVAEVVQERHVTLVTTSNGGRSWKRLPEGPKRIWRDGVFLWGTHNGCPHVISQSGHDWIKTSTSNIPRHSQWLQWGTFPQEHLSLRHSRGYSSNRTSMVPDEDLFTSTCEPTPPPRNQKATDITLGARTSDSRCSPMECLSYSSTKTPVGQRLRAALSASSAHSTVILADTERRLIKALKPPSGCDPRFVLQGPGIFILGCSTELGLGLYTSDSARNWHLEGELTGLSSTRPTLDWAEDGTLLLNNLCRQSDGVPSQRTTCRNAALRKPSELGAPGLWHVLPESENTLAHRVLTNGRALLVNLAANRRSNAINLATFTGEGGFVPLCALATDGQRVTNIGTQNFQLIVTFGTSPDTVTKRVDLTTSGLGTGTCSLH